MFGRSSKEQKITESISIICREIIREPLTKDQERGLLRRLEANRGVLDISGLYQASKGVLRAWEGMQEGARDLRDNTERFLGIPLKMEVVEGGKKDSSGLPAANKGDA